MSQIQISALPPLPNGTGSGTPLGSDIFPGTDITDFTEAATGTTKKYTRASGVNFLFNALSYNTYTAVQASTTAALTVTYANGAAGVGATLTNAGAQAALVLDGIHVVVGDRILVKNQASTFQNGIYTVTVVGTGATNWVLTRATDADQSVEIVQYAAVLINAGAANASKMYQVTNASGPVIGTDPITFALASLLYNVVAGSGISIAQSTNFNTISNAGVLSGQGTANQVLVNGTSGSAQTGALIFTLPQSIGTGSSPTFSGITLTTGTISTTPAAATDIANKGYVDTIAQGITVQGACYAGTTADLAGYTYSNGVSGVGATLTAGSNAAFSTDGVSPALNARILVKNQSTTFQNGIYTLTQVGSGILPAILTRATDYDQAAEIQPGDLVIITAGATLTASSWIETATVTTIGTDAISFSQFTSALPVNVASGGTGLSAVAQGDLLYGSATNVYSLLNKNITATRYLSNQGTSNNPSWNQVNLANGVTGTLPIANGGTNVTSVTTAPTATAFAGWDANSNLSAVNHIEGFTSITSAAGTTTLVVGSNYTQQVVGSTTQTIQMPVTSTLVAGQSWQIINNSTGTVTVNSSGGNAIVTLSSNTAAIVTCILASGTTAASWTTSFTSSGGGSGVVTDWVAYTPTFTGFGTVANVQIWSRRVGDTLHIRGRFQAGTTTATEARITLGYAGTNSNVTSSSTKITSIQDAGTLILDGTSTAAYYTLIETNVGYITIGVQSGATAGLTKLLGNNFFSNQVLSLMAEVPIASFP